MPQTAEAVAGAETGCCHGRARVQARIRARAALNVWRALALAPLLLAGCEAFTGYATDPATDTNLPVDLADGFKQNLKDQYVDAPDPIAQRQVRDKIIYRQLTAYDLEFEAFERGLTGNDNVFSLTADASVLALASAGTVAGGETVKSALAAATAFITGTKTSVNQDLFFKSTLPALKAQMEARRLQAKVSIVRGLGQGVADYPLQKALVDLGTLRAAASLGTAIASTTEDAGVRARAAQVAIDLAPADAQFKAATPARFSLQGAIRGLRAPQALAMMQSLEPVLQSRPETIRSRVLRFDPNGLRLTNGEAARQVLEVWRREDLTDDASLAQWTKALDAARESP